MASDMPKAFRVVGFCFGAQRDQVSDINFRGTSPWRDVTSRGRRRFGKSAAVANRKTRGASSRACRSGVDPQREAARRARPLRLRPRRPSPGAPITME
jgi:hypothetical protein